MAASGRADNAVIGVNHLKELTNDKRHRLDALHLLLCSQQLALQVLSLILDIFLLRVSSSKKAVSRLNFKPAKSKISHLQQNSAQKLSPEAQNLSPEAHASTRSTILTACCGKSRAIGISNVALHLRAVPPAAPLT
jgi:hypothetical protein